MADIVTAPKVRCDNCGQTVEKMKGGLGHDEWERPREWGSLSVSATVRSHYPNDIKMSDLCGECLKAVHYAVGEALKTARGGV